MSNTARNFALQLGALITLYISLTTVITLAFAVINAAFPDEADLYYAYAGYGDTIRFSIATLIVVFPTYMALTRYVNKIRRNEQGVYLNLTKWLIYLSLLVGGGVLLGDFVAIINAFLNGELTTRFVLKALVLGAVVAAAFFYYLRDAQNFWQTRERESIWYGAAAAAVVVAVLVAGFFYSKTPQQVRELRLDERQVNDLQTMQGQIEEYYRVNQALPADMSALADFTGLPAIEPPEDRTAYQYNVIDDTRYELCANFASPSPQLGSGSMVSPIYERNYNWTHPADEHCFTRVIIEALER